MVLFLALSMQLSLFRREVFTHLVCPVGRKGGGEWSNDFGLAPQVRESMFSESFKIFIWFWVIVTSIDLIDF